MNKPSFLHSFMILINMLVANHELNIFLPIDQNLFDGLIQRKRTKCPQTCARHNDTRLPFPRWRSRCGRFSLNSRKLCWYVNVDCCISLLQQGLQALCKAILPELHLFTSEQLGLPTDRLNMLLVPPFAHFLPSMDIRSLFHLNTRHK